GAEMMQRFEKIITKVNKLIHTFAPEEVRKEWQVSVQNGTVAFGSAYYNWGMSVPYMKKTGLNFKDIYEHCAKDEQKALSKKAPVHQVLLDMAVDKLPSPLEAQKYRIPNIWQGDLESVEGKAMMECDADGPLSLMITKIWMDPHAGEVAVGRVYSGSIKHGETVWAIGGAKAERVQQVSMMVGSDRIQVPEVSAGNIAAITGIRSAAAGVTIARKQDSEPFEAIRHYSEPVVTVAVEPKAMKDLPKFIDALRGLAKADASLEVSTNSETGEALLAGMGELHLEITVYRLEEERGIKVKVSEPIVVYRESIQSENAGRAFEGKSPNRHNRFYIEAEPLAEDVVQALRDGHFGDGNVRNKDSKAVGDKFAEFGMEKNLMRKIFAISGTNVLVNDTKGIQNLHETRELIIDGFNEVCKKGPLAEEPLMGVMLRLVDAKLHEDAIHRGPAQTIPAVRNACRGALIRSGPVILEPMQNIRIDAPNDVIGGVTREVTNRRGVIEDMPIDGGTASVIGKMPVAESFGFSNDIRAATQGRAIWNTENAGFEILPRSLLEKIVGEIRERKGLKPEVPGEAYYTD
ncbi:MAG: elongation factor EF-2, partial [Candidatus Poseidoniia archaeon]